MIGTLYKNEKLDLWMVKFEIMSRGHMDEDPVFKSDEIQLHPDDEKLVSVAYNKGLDRKSTRLNSSHVSESRMPSSA